MGVPRSLYWLQISAAEIIPVNIPLKLTSAHYQLCFRLFIIDLVSTSDELGTLLWLLEIELLTNPNTGHFDFIYILTKCKNKFIHSRIE